MRWLFAHIIAAFALAKLFIVGPIIDPTAWNPPDRPGPIVEALFFAFIELVLAVLIITAWWPEKKPI